MDISNENEFELLIVELLNEAAVIESVNKIAERLGIPVSQVTDVLSRYKEIAYASEEDDGQPSEYTEWQDYMGGDDWDQGQYEEG